VIGDLVGKLYDVAGPDVALTATVSATVNPVVSPWWTIGFTLAGTAALHFQVLVATVDVSATVNVLSVTVAQATGSSGGAPPVITTTKLPDAAVNQNYSTDLTTADHRKGTWAIAAGSLPFGMTLSGFTISGQPDTVGTNTFTLRFTDTTGHVVTARASITVVGGNGTVSGRVTDTHGDGLGNVTVQAFGTRNSGFLETDSDGDFTGSLPSGQYDFCFDGSTGTGGTSDATGYVFSCFDNNATLNVAPGGTVSGINVSLATGGAVSGQLTGHDGQPEGQAFIFPRDPSNGISAGGGANYVSNEDGSYTVKGLPTGSYALCFETLQEPTPANLGDVDKCYQNAPFSVTQTGGGTPVSVTAGKTTTGINLSFAEGGAISGRLTDANGNPVAGIAVSAEGDGPLGASGYDAGGHEATTDDNGDYEIGDLAPGTEYDVCDIGDTQHFFACFGGNTEPLATVTVTAGHVTPNVNWTVPTASGAAGARLTHG
jgi:hypothetical protein